MSYHEDSPIPDFLNLTDEEKRMKVEVAIITHNDTIGPLVISYRNLMHLEFAVGQSEGVWKALDLTPGRNKSRIILNAASIIGANYVHPNDEGVVNE